MYFLLTQLPARVVAVSNAFLIASGEEDKQIKNDQSPTESQNVKWEEGVHISFQRRFHKYFVGLSKFLLRFENNTVRKSILITSQDARMLMLKNV